MVLDTCRLFRPEISAGLGIFASVVVEKLRLLQVEPGLAPDLENPPVDGAPGGHKKIILSKVISGFY